MDKYRLYIWFENEDGTRKQLWSETNEEYVPLREVATKYGSDVDIISKLIKRKVDFLNMEIVQFIPESDTYISNWSVSVPL